MAENIGFYDIIKKTKGSLTLNLPSYDMTSQPRRVHIAHNAKKVRIPRVFALGVFVDPTLEKAYKAGKFVIEPVKQFEAEVSEIFYPVENKVELISDEDIIKMLKQGNRVGIKKAIEENPANRDNIIILARDNIGDISHSMIKDLNAMFGTEMEIEDE